MNLCTLVKLITTLLRVALPMPLYSLEKVEEVSRLPAALTVSLIGEVYLDEVIIHGDGIGRD